MIPDGLPCRISNASFITFPEALRNAEAERLSTINALYINFMICFMHLQFRLCVHWDFVVHNFDQIVEMANLATKPSSRDDGLVARLSISTNMLHKPYVPRFNVGSC